MIRSNNILGNLDKITIVIYLLLLFVGWICVYSSIYDVDHTSIFDMSQRYGMQFIWILTSLALAFLIMLCDTKIYTVFSLPIYLLGLFSLVFVLFFGTEVNGSKSWISLGAVRIQPVEFTKMATALMATHVMSEYGFKVNSLSNIFKLILIFAAPIILILLQKDTGSALVFASFLIVLYREGLNGWLVISILYLILLFIASLLLSTINTIIALCIVSFLVYIFLKQKKLGTVIKSAIMLAIGIIICLFINNEAEWNIGAHYIILICCAVFSAITIIINIEKVSKLLFIVIFFFVSVFLSFSVDYVFDNFLKQHQRDRIEDLFGMTVDLQGTGYNVHQSKIAIGSGGLIGKGFLQGTQTKFSFVPEQSTDFIFCTVGEEWGLVGCLVVIGLYVFLLFRIVIIAERQRFAFSRIYAYCVLGILFFHFAANICMTIGLMPVIGIPLPFLSYGGSSLWAFTILLFILLKLDTKR